MIDHTKVTASPTIKVSVRITLREMWDNYMEFQKDIIWDNGGLSSGNCSEFFEESRVLCNFGGGANYHEDESGLIKMFKGGYTSVLLGDYMEVLDKPNILREVIVIDTAQNNKEIIIHHADINF